MRCVEVACITHPISPQQLIAKLIILSCNRKAVHTIISRAIKTAGKRAKPVARLLICRICKTSKPHGVRDEKIVSIYLTDYVAGPGEQP